MRNAEVFHSGILGQKWGVRRYQNEDGTYTAEGKERRRKSWRSDDREIRRQRKEIVRKRRTLSDEELDAYTKRMQKENLLSQTYTSNVKGVEKGEAFVGKFSNQLENAIIATATASIVLAGKKYATKWFGK